MEGGSPEVALLSQSRKIFSLPRGSVTVALLIIATAATFVTCSSFYTSPLGLVLSLSIIIIPLLDWAVCRSLGGKALTARRASYTVLLLSVAIAASLSWRGFLFLLPILVAGVLTLRSVLYAPLLHDRLIVGILAAQVGVVPLVVILLYLSLVKLSSATALLITPVAASLIFYAIVDHSVRGKTRSFTGFEIARAFSLAWLADDYERLEDVLTRISADEEIEAQVMVFGEECFKLLVPWFHNGPFRGVGSSSFSAQLATLPVFLGKGPATHERDLPSRAECARVYCAINGVALERMESVISDVVNCSVGRARALCFLVDRVAIVVLSAAPEDMEDVPTVVGRRIRKAARDAGLRDAIVIDAHNSLSSPRAAAETPQEEFVEAGRRAIVEAIKSARTTLVIGFSHMKSSARNVGQYGVSALCFKTPSGWCGLVTIDANNIVPALRNRLISALRKAAGLREVEILTTDTHEMAGISGATYKVLDDDAIIRDAITVAREALARAEVVSVAYGCVSVKGRVIGKRGLEILADAATAGLRGAKAGAGLCVLMLMPLALI